MLLKLLVIFIFLIGAFQYIGIANGWDVKFWWFDIPLHIAGGGWTALLFIYLFKDRIKSIIWGKKYFFYFFGLSFVALLSLLWEFMEYFLDKIKPYRFWPAELILKDTFDDFVNDFLGAGLIFILYELSLIFRTKRVK